MALLRKGVNLVSSQLRHHPDLLPLFVSYSLVPVAATGIILYTMSAKGDVKVNRFQPDHMESLNRGTPQQRLLIPNFLKGCFKDDGEKEYLRGVVYDKDALADDEWAKTKGGKIN